MILKEFINHNTIVEKSDVERRESEVSAGAENWIQIKRDRFWREECCLHRVLCSVAPESEAERFEARWPGSAKKAGNHVY